MFYIFLQHTESKLDRNFLKPISGYLTFSMKSVTDVLIRRAASQAVSLARQNCRALYTDPPNRAPETNVMTEVPRRVHEETETHKTIHDLPGPGLPVFGTTFEITRNYLQYHELQVRDILFYP